MAAVLADEGVDLLAEDQSAGVDLLANQDQTADWKPYTPSGEREGATWKEVVESLPAQLVGSAESVAKNLKVFLLREGISTKEEMIAKTAKSASALKIAQAEQDRLGIERAEKSLETAVPAAAKGREILASVTPQGMSIPQKAVSSLAQSAPSTLAGIAVGVATKNPALAMTIAGGGGAIHQAGSTYGEATEKGAPHPLAARAAAIDGILEGLGEAIPLHYAFKPGSAIFKRIWQTIATEVGQETATQLAQDLNAYLSYNPEITLQEALENMQVAALAGAMGGAVYGTAGQLAQRSTEKSQADTELRRIAEDIEAVDVTQGNEQAAVDLLAPERTQLRAVPKAEAAAAQQAPVEISTPTEPVAPAAQAAPGEAVPAAVVSEPPPAEEPAVEAPARPPARPRSTREVGQVKEILQVMAENSGHLERGGRAMRELSDTQAGGDVVGVTSWIGQPQWARGLGANPAEITTAVEKAIAGKTLGAKQQDIVDAMLAEIDATRSNITEAEAAAQTFAEEAGLPPIEPVAMPEDLGNIRDFVPAGESELTGPRLALAELSQRAHEFDEATAERLAIQFEGNDAEYAAALQEIINANVEDVAGRDNGVGEEVEPFALASETEVERQAREATARDRDARDRAEADRGDARARADLERDDFGLTGSERAADLNPDQEDLLSVGDQTQTQEFKRWFGESKVVDAEGKPLRVFHGTNESFDVPQPHSTQAVHRLNGKEIKEANSWDMGEDRTGMPEGYHYGALSDAATLGAKEALRVRTEEAQSGGHMGKPDTERTLRDLRRLQDGELTWKAESRPSGAGMWFTPDTEYSFISRRNTGSDPGANVMPVYLSIKNPIYLNASEIEGAGLAFKVEQYKKQGYDGAVFADNPKDMAKTGWSGATQIVAFEPTQIKSAIGNRGTFDPSNPDIRFATTDTLTPAAERSWDEIRERVAELAKQITPTINARTVRSVWSGETQAAGRYNIRHKFIEISLTAGDQETTFRHEAVHGLRDMGLFTPQEWRMLEREAARTWRREFDIDRLYAGRKLANEQLLEEAVASAYGEYRSGYLTAAPQLVRVMRKIKEFFDRLGNLLRGMGFRSIDDVFESIEAGEVGTRKPGEGPWLSPDGVLYALGPNVNNPPTPAVQQNYLISAQRALRQRLTNPPPNTWEADIGLGKRLFVTPRTIAVFERDFVPVYQTAIDQWKFRDQLIAMFERESEAYFRASPEDQAVVGRILEHDRLTGQVGLAGQNMTVHFTSSAAVLSQPGERVTVTDAQKTAYWSVRSMLNMALDEFKAQTLEDFGLPRNTPPAQIAQMIAQATVPADAIRLQKVADLLQGIEDARRAGYVPFSRYGEIGISVRHPLTKALLHYETIEVGMMQRRGGKPIAAMPEVIARVAALRAKYPGQAISEPFQVPKTGMPTQVRLEEVDALAEMAKIDNATWDSVRAKLEQAVASQGFRAHFFRSKNIPGYSPDFERGLANYVNGISGYLARRRFASKWVAAIAPISLNKPRLRQYAQDYQKYVNSPAEEFGALRSINFVFYLTSVASWMVNLSQVPFVSMPWATQFANPAAVSTAFIRAEAEAAAMLTLKQGVQMYSATKAPADVRAAVQDAYDQGLFIPITTYESMGIARNQGRRLRKVSRAAQLAQEIFGFGFTTAERQNRIATFIALYRLARDNPQVGRNFARVMKDNALARRITSFNQQGHGYVDAAKFAEFGIDDTHFKAGKVNRPTLARNAGTLVFQFKMFTWNMLERMVTMGTLQGAEGRAALILMLSVIGMVSGIWGLPGAEDMRDLWELYMKNVKNRDINADAEMRKIIVDLTRSTTLAQAVSGGVPRALPEPWNIDLSHRIGLGNIVPTGPGEVFGVTYDLWAKRPLAAMEQFEADNFLLGMAELMPKQAADFAAQLGWAESGVRTKSSDRPVIPKEDVTTGMRVAKAIGFTSGTIANIREAERAEQVAKRAANIMRSQFYRRMAKAVAEGVRAEESGDLIAGAAADQRAEKIWQEIEEWNNTHPEDYLQVYLDRKSSRTNLIREFEGADYDKGTRRQAKGEIERLRQVYGREP